MDNENKEIEFGPQGTEEISEEVEFDPTESEEFYNNLEAAIGFGEEPEEEIPELLLTEEALENTGDGEQKAYSSAEEDLFAGVDAALAEQIEQEFGKDTEISTTEEKAPNKFVAMLREIPTWTKVLVTIILVILLSVGLLFGTPGGRKLIVRMIVGVAFDNIPEDPDDMGYITPAPDDELSVTPEPTENPDLTPEPTGDPDLTPEPTDDPALTPEPTATPVPAITLMDDENIINVLLLGEENMKGAIRGRADAIILVSVNLEGGPLKMVSFQRDLYVSIPGRADDKLNAAYAYGGAKLIMETIEQNFGVDIDSYVKVGFDGFENIIDQLGGLRLSLTARESEYLNTTKYISKPEERNTVAGYQTMTGAQVLGYCRVRYVPTAEGLSNDFGRNYRQRVVLKAIFDQYKNKSFAELATVMRQCFNYVSAPSDLEELAVDCLTAVIEKKMFEIETMQVPQSGKYTDATIGGKDVIVFYPECVTLLQDFLYGE